MARRKRKIIKYRRKPNAAVIIFSFVLIYVIAFVIIFLSKPDVRAYEVDSGSILTNAAFSGIAIRDEQVVYSDYSGNINYYKKEGTRVRSTDTVCTVDETGRVAQILEEYSNSGENSLSKSSLRTIKTMLNNFKIGYTGDNFGDVYDLKTEINSTVLQAMNENIMSNLEAIIENTGSQNLFRTLNAGNVGIVAYYVDGYETLLPEEITDDKFDKNNYAKSNLKAEELIVANSPAFKVVTSENWSIMIKLTQNDIDTYGLADKKSVTIKFKKDNVTAKASFSIVNNNGSNYGKITLSDYMIRYVTDRFLDIEIVSSSKTGLKIPASAVIENEFYTIPNEFMVKGGNSNSNGFICESYDENGQLVTNFVQAKIYKKTDELCYVDKSAFDMGSCIVMEDSSQRYLIGAVEKLKGVYCINTGYTSFKIIEIIDQNNEYYIIRKGTAGGISMYDRILLDAEKYELNQMVY